MGMCEDAKIYGRRCITPILELEREAMTPEERIKSDEAFNKKLNEIKQRRAKEQSDKEQTNQNKPLK